MKKQLIVLSALFIGFASQCNTYDQMKASAQEKYEAGKSKLIELKESAKNKYQTARDRLRGTQDRFSTSTKEQVGDQSYEMREQVGDSIYGSPAYD